MLWIKTLHIFLVVSWFAAIFYLPRILVNLAMVSADSQSEYQRLLLMANKLYRFGLGLGVLATVFGLWLWLAYGYAGGWLHAKVTLVACLWGYYVFCGHLVAKYRAGQASYSHVALRFFNEIPVLLLFAIVALVVLKPF